jgi:NADH-quinone oxidoreductase subunit L
VTAILLILLLFPLAGGVLNAVVGRLLPRRLSEVIACIGVLGALVMACLGLAVGGHQTFVLSFCRWITAGDFVASLNVYYDPLSAAMALMVTFVSSLIHLYSVAFMRRDKDYVRYFSYLNLFVFSMLVITLADNLIFVYLGWEGVGFCSYALIGFWYQDVAKATAGRKAFILTRIGDAAFGVALGMFFYYFRNFNITYIIAHAATLGPVVVTVLSLLLLWAAVGKSAQLPLTVWLPDAMAGPTPVSALIHAATMVTAGVYLLMRLFPLLHLSPTALLVITGVGAVTTLYSAFAACVQWDIKRVLAYSTISQVGYMILGVGAGDIVGSFYHLLSHAFFKALLFMCAGCVIQALDEEHDIFKMGNLHRLMPGVSYLFLAGALCLSAFPLLGGYFSKDRILLATFLHHDPKYWAFWAVAALAALLTPIYTFRLYFVAFLSRPDGRTREEIRPIPKFMVWVLVPLAVLALCDGALNIPGSYGKNFLGYFLSTVPGARPDLGAPGWLEWDMRLGSASLVVLVIVLTYFLFRWPRPAVFEGLHETLFTAFYLDWLYLRVIARPYQWISGFLWQNVDEGGVDRGFESTAGGLKIFSAFMGLWTSGRLSTYLIMLFLGLTAMFAVLAMSWSW